MRISDLSAGAGQLRDALETLELKWADTRQYWNDANSQNLEENHLRPLAGEVVTALTVIQHLSEVLGQAQRECGSW